MESYCAIVQRRGQWEYLATGEDPQEVYRQAVELLQGPDEDERELPVVLPDAEQALDTLRVVPVETAQETYHAVFVARRAEDIA